MTLYKRRCNATQGKGVEEKEERGERGRERKREWLGEIVQGESTWGLIPSNLSIAGTRLGAICRFIQFGICDPTYSPFSLSPSHLAQIEIHPLLFSFTSSHLSRRARASSLPFSLPPPRPYLRIATLFSRYLLSYHILAPFLLTNPTCMRLFPHVVLIIYTFSNSRLFFFLIPSDQTGGAFILTPYPLICAAMCPAIPHTPHPITFVPLQSLTQPKRAPALGLPAFLHHHVNPPKRT